MSRDTVAVGDAMAAIIDYRGKTPPKSDVGTWLVTAKVVKNGFIVEQPKEYIPTETYASWMRRGLPRIGDVLLTTEAPLGQVAAIRSTADIALAQRLILLRADPDILNQDFLLYSMQAPVVQDQLRSRASGTTVLGIKQAELRKIRLPAPPRTFQDAVAKALRAFDDLIENNRRRIEILEEMARLLYREWFVQFRFPGHEDVDPVDSELGPIPADWTTARLADVAEVNASSVRKGDDLGEILYLDISSVGPRTMAPPEPMLFSEAPGRARRCVQHGDVIWSTVRPNRRSHVMIQSPATNLICSTGFAVLSANSVPPSYLLELCSTDDFVSHLESLATGAAYPAVRPVDFEAYRFVRPPNDLLQRWDEQLRPMNDLVGNLTQQNRVLREARDLLLPRLVSGELDVSELDLGGLVA